MPMFLRLNRARSLVIASSLLGLGLLVGCDSAGSSGASAPPGTLAPRFQKIEQLKAKAGSPKP